MKVIFGCERTLSTAVLWFVLVSSHLTATALARSEEADLQGHWEGTIRIGTGARIDFQMDFEKVAGEWTASGRMTTSGADMALEFFQIVVRRESVFFATEIRKVEALFSGTLGPDSIEGTVELGGMERSSSGVFSVTRSAGAKASAVAKEREDDDPADDGALWGVDQEEVRGASRLVYYIRTPDDRWSSTPGQVVVNYGRARWNDSYESFFQEGHKKRRWRLGSNFWTTLDVGIAFRLAGELIEAGYYYLVLESKNSRSCSLLLLSPREVRNRHLDAWHADKRAIPAERRIDLARDNADRKYEELSIRFVSPVAEREAIRGEVPTARASLEILFGRHRLTVPVEIPFSK